jgi:uncharacterized protein YndB with AHSA1/START domain
LGSRRDPGTVATSAIRITCAADPTMPQGARMNTAATEMLSVVIERDLGFPPEKIWRALTQPHLIEEWLMKNDFKPVLDERFTLRGDWGSVECQVRTIEPCKTLSYTWAAYGASLHGH